MSATISRPPVLSPALPLLQADVDDYFRPRNPKPLIFCRFASGHGGDSSYNEVTDFARLQRTLGDALAQYNEMNAGLLALLYCHNVGSTCTPAVQAVLLILRLPSASQ